jgi:hypothetical protein
MTFKVIKMKKIYKNPPDTHKIPQISPSFLTPLANLRSNPECQLCNFQDRKIANWFHPKTANFHLSFFHVLKIPQSNKRNNNNKKSS